MQYSILYGLSEWEQLSLRVKSETDIYIYLSPLITVTN